MARAEERSHSKKKKKRREEYSRFTEGKRAHAPVHTPQSALRGMKWEEDEDNGKSKKRVKARYS